MILRCISSSFHILLFLLSLAWLIFPEFIIISKCNIAKSALDSRQVLYQTFNYFNGKSHFVLYRLVSCIQISEMCAQCVFLLLKLSCLEENYIVSKQEQRSLPNLSFSQGKYKLNQKNY